MNGAVSIALHDRVDRHGFRLGLRWVTGVGVTLCLASCGRPETGLHTALARRQEARAAQQAPPDDAAAPVAWAGTSVEPEVAEVLPADVLTLEQARALAVRGNPDVHAAQARLEAAAARVQQANSYFLPSLTASFNSSRTFLTPASRNRVNTALQPFSTLPTDVTNTNDLAVTTLLNAFRGTLFGNPDITGSSHAFSEHATALTATWTVFDSFAREARLLAARYAERASEYALDDVQRLLRRAVDTAYFQVQLAQEQERIAQADEVFSREQFELTERLHEAGRATKADVNNFKVRLLDAQAQVSAARNAREAGRVALAELMGLAGTILPETLALSALEAEAETELTVPDSEPWIERALEARPDLLRLDQIVTSLHEEARVSRALYGPSVVVSGSWGYDRVSTIRYEDDDQSSAVGVELRWDLYTGGRRTALVREAEALKAEGVAQLHRQRLAVAGASPGGRDRRAGCAAADSLAAGERQNGRAEPADRAIRLRGGQRDPDPPQRGAAGLRHGRCRASAVPNPVAAGVERAGGGRGQGRYGHGRI